MTVKRIKTKQITSWSYSRYSAYKQCPLKAKLKFLDKVPEPPSEHLERGREVHLEAEEYIRGDLKRITKSLLKFKKLFQALRKDFKKRSTPVILEEQWAFTKDWELCRWDDWAACWLRVKVDCAYYEDDTTLIIKDWKTGKFSNYNLDGYIEQLELFALAALVMYPHIKCVKVGLVYLDHGICYPTTDREVEELTFFRNDIAKLKKLWDQRAFKMLNDKQFNPKPNNLCKFCHYRKDNKENGGGQCRY